MKKLWKTLLVTLLVVSMLSGMVTAFADEDPVDSEPQPTAVDEPEGVDGDTPTSVDADEVIDEPEVTDDPVDDEEEVIPPTKNGEVKAQEVGGPKTIIEEPGTTPTADTSEEDMGVVPASEELVDEPTPQAEEPIYLSIGTDCLEGKVLPGGEFTVRISAPVDELKGSYTATNVKEPASGEFELTGGEFTNCSKSIVFTAGDTIGPVTFKVEITSAKVGDKSVELQFPKELMLLEVVSADSVASEGEKAELQQKVNEVKAALAYTTLEGNFSFFAAQEDYTINAWNAFQMAFDFADHCAKSAAVSAEDVGNALAELTETYEELQNHVYDHSNSLATSIESLEAALERAYGASDLSAEAEDLLSRVQYDCNEVMFIRLNEGEDYYGKPYDEYVKDAQYWTEVVNNIADKQIPAKKDDLSKFIADVEGEGLDSALYTEDSWNALQDELERSKETIGNEYATQAEVDDCLSCLENARNGLLRKIDENYVKYIEDKLNEEPSVTLTEDGQMAYERAKAMLQSFVESYYKAEDKSKFSFYDPQGKDYSAVPMIVNTLEQAFDLALQGKMPADRTELKKAVEDAKKALEKQKAFTSNEEYKKLEAGIADAEYVIDFKAHPDATLRMPGQLSQMVSNLKDQTAKVLALKSDEVPKTGDPLVPVLAGGVVLMTLLAAAWVGKKALYRK